MLGQRMQTGPGHGIGRIGRGGDRLLGPHRIDVADGAGPTFGDRNGNDFLGDEEGRFVQLRVLVIVRVLVL